MAKASASFHLNGEFYAEGSVLPKDVASVIGKHLIASAPAKAAATEAKAKVEEEVKTDEVKTDESEPEVDQEWVDQVNAMDNAELIEAAQVSGITGKLGKAALKEQLILNGKPA